MSNKTLAILAILASAAVLAVRLAQVLKNPKEPEFTTRDLKWD